MPVHVDSLPAVGNPGYDCSLSESEREAAEKFANTGIRTWLLSTYEIGRWHYSLGEPQKGNTRKNGSSVRWANEFGCMLWYGNLHPGTRKKTMIDVSEFAARWHRLIVGLAVAHDKDEADRYEAAVDECLSPLLAAPVKQLREFAVKVKLGDSRSKGYIDEFGEECWELDAMEPDVVTALITDQVLALRDQKAWDKAVREEDEHKRNLQLCADGWPEVVEFLVR